MGPTITFEGVTVEGCITKIHDYAELVQDALKGHITSIRVLADGHTLYREFFTNGQHVDTRLGHGS